MSIDEMIDSVFEDMSYTPEGWHQLEKAIRSMETKLREQEARLQAAEEMAMAVSSDCCCHTTTTEAMEAYRAAGKTQLTDYRWVGIVHENGKWTKKGE